MREHSLRFEFRVVRSKQESRWLNSVGKMLTARYGISNLAFCRIGKKDTIFISNLIVDLSSY